MDQSLYQTLVINIITLMQMLAKSEFGFILMPMPCTMQSLVISNQNSLVPSTCDYAWGMKSYPTFGWSTSVCFTIHTEA